jgi:UDP-2-acetamido-3-amino-2,3-dideoxy-glucuronate N-acetyltransferase
MIHPTADVSPDARIGEGTRIWHEAQVREGAVIGAQCNVGKGAYIDRDVIIGNRVKVQNRASIFRGVTIEDGVYIGPHVSFANDKYPRAVNPDGSPKSDGDWQLVPTLVREGASIGTGAVVLPGVTIGRWALVGAGAVVTRDVPEQALVTGNPARMVGYVCMCGRPLGHEGGAWRCPACDCLYKLEKAEMPS